MKKNLLTFGIILFSALNIHSQTVNSISPNSGNQGQTLSVSISGTNMNYGSWSGTLSNFRFSQFSGSNMFYGNPTSTSLNNLYGDVTIPNGQSTGWHDLEVHDYNTNQWVQKNNAFYVSPVSTTASWNCISAGNCQDPGTGLGQYATQAACIAQCVVTPSWDCISVGNCQDPGTGLGQYATQAACATECDSSTSIISQEIEYLNIYPNPTNGILNIQFSILNSQDIILNLVNTVGEVIFTESLSNYIGEYNKQINLESYSKAIYFLEIKTDNGIVNKKLILQ